ncbi:uncharacterized protein LOC114158218 isoform X2 [Xiphophorus couchianus]|uniref:uncharacterized protein LOC114158218 isoform X2 n=1 Tax=Xiphophorus couchianus TaxID=32473 RepID=UPI0010167E30|nr:uncharacterized protein LOC114158218 isoform X2 [Xiphophorus couchianus]
MMLSSKWISKILFTILMLQLTATAGQQRAFFTVKAGDGVTLPCVNVTEKKHNCDRVTWTFSQPGNRSVSLFERGNFTEEANAKPGRLSVTANCSLVIKNVTMEDVGQYYCRQNHLRKVDLSVVTMTKQRNSGKVTFTCSVSQYIYCRHTVWWLYEGKEKISPDMNVSSTCSAAVTIPAFHLHQNSTFYELLKCKVYYGYEAKQYQLFTFNHQSSGKKREQPTAATATTSATTNSILTKSDRTESASSTSSRWRTSETPTATGLTENNQTKSRGWIWWAVIVSMLLAGLLITVMVTIGWIKTKGSKKQKEDQPVEPYASYTSMNLGMETGTKSNVPDPVIYSTLQPHSAVI